MSPVGDEDLRRLFEERRTSDEEKAPPFQKLLGRGRSGARPAWIPLAGLVTAVAAILALAVSLALPHRRPQPAIRIEEWKAPTDFLLDVSYPNLLDTTPAPPEAVPDYSLLLATEKGTMP